MRKCLLYFIDTICFKLKFVQFMYAYIKNNACFFGKSKYELQNKNSISVFFIQLFLEVEVGASNKKFVVLQY